jgi:hypothetical protein
LTSQSYLVRHAGALFIQAFLGFVFVILNARTHARILSPPHRYLVVPVAQQQRAGADSDDDETEDVQGANKNRWIEQKND